jgi:hypothetical protein
LGDTVSAGSGIERVQMRLVSFEHDVPFVVLADPLGDIPPPPPTREIHPEN